MAQQASKILNSDEIEVGLDENQNILDELSVVDKCQQGDIDAFAQLVNAYQNRIYNVVLRMGNLPADAEEITQEAFLKAFEKINTFKKGSMFYTWIFKIATNIAITRSRRSKKVNFYSLQGSQNSANTKNADQDFSSFTAVFTTKPDEPMMSSETIKVVQQALAMLEESQKMVVVFRDIEGMDYAKIAEILDLPVGTIKSKLHRARTTLKEKLADLVVEND